jgi:hypothetical protein
MPLLHSVSDITGSSSSSSSNGIIYSYHITGLQRLLELLEFEDSRISRQSANESDKVANTMHRPL